MLPADVYTMGQVAKMLGVSPRTATKWCDAGILQHYRIPLSKDRRVHRADLDAFILEHGLRVRAVSVLVSLIGAPEGYAEPSLWPSSLLFRVQRCDTLVEAGICLARTDATVKVAVFDARRISRSECDAAAHAVSSFAKCVIICGDDDASPSSNGHVTLASDAAPLVVSEAVQTLLRGSKREKRRDNGHV